MPMCAMKLARGRLGLLKGVVIAALLLLGVLFTYQGLGHDFRILNFDFLDTSGIPIGAALIVAAMLVARFWRIPG